MTDSFFASEERDLADWLLAASTSADYTPFVLWTEPSVSSQLAYLISLRPLEQQQKFRRAVITAISEWIMDVHGFDALQVLAVLAAYVRTTDAIMGLSHLVRSRLLPQLAGKADPTGKIEETVGKVAAVIAGFAPHPHANAAAEALYYDERLPHRFLPVLLTALCRAYPDTFPDYLPRTLLRMRDHPDRFHYAMILDRVVETVTPIIFSKHFFELDSEIREAFSNLLSRAGTSRIALIADRKTVCLETRFGGDTSVWPCPMPQPERASTQVFAKTYEPLVTNYRGVEALLDDMLQMGVSR